MKHDSKNDIIIEKSDKEGKRERDTVKNDSKNTVEEKSNKGGEAILGGAFGMFLSTSFTRCF